MKLYLFGCRHGSLSLLAFAVLAWAGLASPLVAAQPDEPPAVSSAQTEVPPASLDQDILQIWPNASLEERQKISAMLDFVSEGLSRIRIDPVFAEQVLRFREPFPVMAEFNADPMSHMRPSMQNLICWNRDMNRLSKQLEKELFEDFVKSDPKYQAVLRGMSIGFYIHYNNPPLMEASQIIGDNLETLLSDVTNEGEPYPCREKKPGSELHPPFAWAQPVRIPGTGDEAKDRFIAEKIAEIRRQVPAAPFDDRSFPARPEEANLLFLYGLESDSPEELLGACIEDANCTSIPDIAFDRPRAKSKAQTSAFLRRTYATQVFREWEARFQDDFALVETGDGGRIVAAACLGRPWDKQEIFSCLLQALGAYPPIRSEGGPWDARNEFYKSQLDKTIAVSLEQIKNIYK